jgi:hypothetical protein
VLGVLIGAHCRAEGLGEPIPGQPPPGLQIEAPAASWGVKGCGSPVIWILLKDGKFYRIDQAHAPRTAEEAAKLFAWLDQGPSDIVEVTCATSI